MRKNAGKWAGRHPIAGQESQIMLQMPENDHFLI